MKMFKESSMVKRVLASFMAFLMVISLMPSMGHVFAAATEHPGYVTIMVVDGESNPIQGANVDYSIMKDPSVTDGDAFTTINSTGTTDEYGVVEVLDATQYIDGCLLISATVSKTGYDNATISSTAISSSEANFSVQLSKTVTMPDIENVTITTLDADYTGQEQELITSVDTDTEGATIEYSTDNSTWSEQIPKETDVAEYSVYVRITKDGYNTYESGEKIAKINAIDIPDIDITAKQFNYVENTSQELVTLTGNFEDTDTVTWSVNNTATGDRSIPTGLAAGSYTVKLEINRGSNYKPFTKEVTSTILNAELNLDGLSVTGLDGTYTGNPQDAVTVSNQGSYDLKYQLDDGDLAVDNNAWSNDIPTVTNAGSYIVWVKANYNDKDVEVTPADNAVAPYNVYIAKAEQTFAFTDSKYNNEESSVEIGSADLTNGKTFNFGATDTAALAGGTISYSLELGAEDGDIATINSTTGELTVTGAGKITVKATLTGNDNYNDCTIQHILNVTAKKSSEGEYVSFPTDSIEYVLGNSSGITANAAIKTFSKDKGAISYSIEDNTDLGLSVSNSGVVTVSDYSKVINAIENANNNLMVTITASKAEVRGWRNNVKWPADSVSYTLRISLRTAPDSAYTVYDVADLNTALTGPDGTNDWFNTAVEIMPASGYSIVRSDNISTGVPTFSASVKYGEMQDAEAQDQGIGDRIIYLKHIETGEITEKIVTSVNKLDNEKPYNVGIEFPEATEKDDVKYYGDEITVTFTAYDNTSGVSKFNWEYTRADGSSTSILEADSGTVEAIRDSHDSTKYVGTLTLPRNQAEQLRGNLKVSATDVADNTCDSYTDTGVFVVDTIAPTQTVSYQLKDGVGTTQTVDTKHYFSNDVVLTFDIVEANFFASDVKIFVSKNGGANQLQTLSWETTENIDENEAKLTLSEDGDYVISMSYEDRSGKVMTSYISDTVVVDKTIPVLEFDYKDYTDTENPQSAIVTITEHNFRASDIEFDVITKNIAGQSVIGNDLQQYLRNLDWTSNGDVHTATISGEFVDAIYDLTFNYKDLALNAAAEIKPEQFIVDRTAPDIAKMSVAYSNPLVDTILSAITFGYYKPTVNVTFTGYDNTAGIDYFTWSYKKENGASNSNVAEYADAKIAAVQDNTDKTKFTATVTLPKETAEQLRGSIAFVSTDKYNNSSNKLTDDNHVIVVDTIAPTMSAEYTTADNTHGEKDYYKKDLTATFTVTEANFYPEDVKIQLKKNDNDVIDITPVWTDVSTDVHVGTYTIDANDDHSNDGDYVFQVEYKDRSNNEMTSYTSGVKVIDTTKPVINVEYSNSNVINELTDTENHTRKYFASAQTATITINEHNFNPGDVNYTIVAKDVAGNELNASSLYTTSSWTSNGDNNIVTITYPGDANYTFDIAYTDLATIEADDFAEQYFTVDTSKPSDLKVTYSTSAIKNRVGAEVDNGHFAYVYDELNRLTEVHQNDTLLRKYSYDAFGNRVSKANYASRMESVTSYTYNVNNQLLSEVDGTMTKDYTYDNRGNLLKVSTGADILKEFTFDATNQMTASFDLVDGQRKKATYTYNGLGHRVGQKISSLIPEYPEKKIRYTIDMTRQYYNLLQKSEGGASQTYYWDGNVVGMESNGVEKFYLQDDFGSPMHLVDIYGTSQECFAFDEFGENLSTSYNNTSQTFGFTGYQTDEVGDLYYAQARRYDASVGRFVSEDKVRGFVILPYTLNHYGYCWNNPVDFVDRDGNLPTVVIGAVIGLAAGALGEVVSQTIDGVQSGKSVLDSLLDVNPGKVVLEAGKGAVTGAVAGTGAGLLVVAGTSGVVEFGGDLLDQKVLQKKEDLDYTHAISNGLWSATTTLVVGGITNEISNVIHPEAKTGTMDYLFGRDKAKAVVKAQYNNARSSSSRAKYWNRLEKIKLQKTLGTIKYGIIETGKTIIDEIKNEIYRDEVNEDIVEEIDKKISCSVY